ncbi:GNAT family N-acetyltransferase [Legionella dresdenensis]|uniref:GNAT family N-acetyltransferase n=1 Tax=Legionella dresdenensis TaxID=450200 RepID=A0ABV8CFW6_9GAMM
MKTVIKAFSELDCDTLYDILALRSEVFVLGQECVYQDPDYHDKNAIHVLIYADEQLAAYARILIDEKKGLNFGRVLTAPQHRKKGLGRLIVQTVLEYIETHYPPQPITISAQHYLQKFYENFGFIIQGELYQLEGIPHITMVRNQYGRK